VSEDKLNSQGSVVSSWGTVAEWLVGSGTLVLAAVAVFQETIRGWFYKPSFHVSIKTEPPDCVAVPFNEPDGTFVADSIYLAKLIPRSSPTPAVQPTDATFLTEFVQPYCPKADLKRQFFDDIVEIKKIGLSRQLPWRQIISHEILDGKPTLSDLSPVIPDRKKDTALKLQFLLEKVQHQEIAIHQHEAFGKIQITPTGDTCDTSLKVKDVDGNEYPLDWSELNRAQREKVIADLQDNKVVLV
jgi:hypothetical protein